MKNNKKYTSREVKEYTQWLLNEKLNLNKDDDEIDGFMFLYGFVYGGSKINEIDITINKKDSCVNGEICENE